MKLIPNEKFNSHSARKITVKKAVTKSSSKRPVPTTVVDQSIKNLKKVADVLRAYANQPTSFSSAQAHELLKNLKEKAFSGIIHIEAQKKSIKNKKRKSN